MKKILYIALLGVFGLSCTFQKEVQPAEGIWLGRLDALDNAFLPFNFQVKKLPEGNFEIEIYNAEEVISVDEIEIKGDSIKIKMPVFEGYIAGTFSKEKITGSFIKESLDRQVPFTAIFGDTARFKTTEKPVGNLSGIWETQFSPGTEDSYPAKGIFTQNGAKVTGTYRTTTGDYRFLEGVVDGDSLRLSAFDGSHAFLFKALISDSTMQGMFYSGNHFKEPFTAKRNPYFELPGADSLTYLKKGFDKLAFSFPDSTDTLISLEDKQFNDKVVIVQIMGTWCPNCLDETKFLVNFLEQQPHPDLQVVALAFETSKTKEIAFNAIKRLQERIGVTYPILLAQYGSSNKLKAQEKLPMIDHILSYPTTIFIDKKGVVRRIHTGFNGPATGDMYLNFKREFEAFVSQLLKE